MASHGETSDARENVSAAENRAWGTLFIVTLVSSSQTSFSIVGLPLYAETAGLSPGQLSSLLGAYPLCAALSALVSGPVSDFYGRKRTLLLGLISLGIFLFLHEFADSFDTLLFFRAGAGLATGILTGLPSLLLSDSFATQRQRSLIGRSLCGYAIGQTLAIPLGIALLEVSGYLRLNAYMGIIALLVTPFARSLLPSATIRYQTAKYSFSHYFSGALSTLKDRRFIGLIVSAVVSFFATATFYVAFSLWLYEEAGMRPFQIAPMFIGAGLLQLIVLGVVTQKIQQRSPELTAGRSFLLNAAIFALFTIGLRDVTAAATLFALSLGAISLRIPSIQHIINLCGSPNHKGLRMSLIQSGNHLGKSIGAVFASMLYPLLSPEVLIASAAIALIPVGIFFLRSERQLSRSNEAPQRLASSASPK